MGASTSDMEIDVALQDKLKRLREKLATNEKPEVEADSAFKGYMQDFNYGVMNALGAPSDIGTLLLNQTMKHNFAGKFAKSRGEDPYQIKSPAIGSEQIRELTDRFGITRKEPPKGLAGRSLRMAGETASIFGPVLGAGRGLAAQAPRTYNEIEKMLISTYQHRYAAAGAESVAIAGGAYGGEVASELYPDSLAAEAIGELTGIVVPGGATALLRFTGSKLPVTSVLKETFSKSGAERRANLRVNEQTADLDTALRNVMSSNELDLDPMTASGDPGVHALFKAALEQDHKLLGRIIDRTDEAMTSARNILLQTGDPNDAIDYLKALRTNAAAKSQEAITRLGGEATPVAAARKVREIIESSLGEARATEKAIWSKLPENGQVEFGQVSAGFENMLRDRAVASDPEEIPSFLYSLVGRLDKEGKFVPGLTSKNPSLKEMKALKSRIGQEIAIERAKDAPSQNKIRILGNLQEDVYDSLVTFSPEYGDAVGFSRELNQKFTQGKVGRLLGYRRTGESRVSPDGTLEFMFSGNKRDVRDGLKQMAASSPESLDNVKTGVKSMFVAQASDNGIVNSAKGQRFVRNNEHILDQFPGVRAEIEQAIDTQVVVDTFVGRNIDSALSTYQKEKSATALYLNSSPEKAMQGLLGAKTDAGQGALMRELVTVTNQDATGKATNGLKTAFAQQLLRSSEGADIETLSGKKMLKNLEAWMPAAKELYKDTPLQLKRIKKIANELRLIEARNAAGTAKGGLISDTPNKILSIISGTIAARAGAAAGQGSSGASLRTASIFTKEWNSLMGRLTNDGAEQILLKATEDPVVLSALLEPATLKSTEKAAKIFSSFLTGQALTMAGRTSGQGPSTELSLEDKLKILRQKSSLQQLGQEQQ